MSTALPAPARRFIASVVVGRFGHGLTLPYTLIMLHEVRHIPLATVGLLLAVPGVVGLVSVPVSGALVDRYGSRSVLRLCLVLVALSSVGLAFANTAWEAFPALVLLGMGLGPMFPASAGLLNGLVAGPEQVQRAFALQFTALNASIGSGALVASLVVDLHRPVTFTAIYLTSAVCEIAQLVFIPKPAARAHDEHGEGDRPSYREALADPMLRRICLVSLALALSGYATLDSGLPAFSRVEGHVAPSVIGLAFVVNTVVIVSGQLLVLRLVRGHKRSQVMALAALIWGVSWASLALLPELPSAGTAVVLTFGGLFGIGEMFTAPTVQPLVNAIASDRLRGRYNAMSGLMFSIGFVVAPAVSGVLIGNGLGLAWLTGIVVLCVIAAQLSWRLSARLTPEQEGLVPSGLDAEREGRLEVVP